MLLVPAEALLMTKVGHLSAESCVSNLHHDL